MGLRNTPQQSTSVYSTTVISVRVCVCVCTWEKRVCVYEEAPLWLLTTDIIGCRTKAQAIPWASPIFVIECITFPVDGGQTLISVLFLPLSAYSLQKVYTGNLTLREFRWKSCGFFEITWPVPMPQTHWGLCPVACVALWYLRHQQMFLFINTNKLAKD